MATAPDSPTVRRLVEFIEAQSDFSGRVAGSEGERMCQTALAGRLDRLGLEAVVEGAVCPPQVPHVLFVHAVAFLGALVLSLIRPGLGALASAVTLVSFWGELRGRPRILRRVLLRRITGNMVARLRNPEAVGKVLVVAHADVASAPRLFREWAARFTIHQRNPWRTLHPGSLVLMAGAVQTVGALEQWSRPDISVFALTGFLVAAVVHAGLLVLAIDWWRSPPVEGAVDNASGLSVAWGVARAVARRPLRNAELWVVATGDREQDCGGMKAFLRQFVRYLDPDRTYVVNVDQVGQGRLHVVTAEGGWERLSYRPTLPGLAERIAARDGFDTLRETEVVGGTDAGPPTELGFRAVTLTSLVEGQVPSVLHTHDDTVEAIEPAAVAEAYDFTLALVREIDDLLSEVQGEAPQLGRPHGALPGPG
jgi:hypothetical protein